MGRAPASTYRLQLTEEFPLAAAADLADYLHALGSDWYYLSPLLKATPGSTHGYDVVDHAQIDPARGGREGLDALAAAARAHGLQVLVDIVPNHVGVSLPEANAWWWEVLRLGPEAPHAAYFDIDWAAGGGRLRIPVLGEPITSAAASGALRVEGGELRYYDHRYPLAPGTDDPAAPVLQVLGAQHYELMDWRRADGDLNYRRFFAVSDLAAIRVEEPEVFDASHVEILRWVRDGLVHGIRVDHPDGLADPGGYLDRLSAATGGAYVLVEKILESGERLPPFWAADGTTGYDALAELDRVLVDPDGRARLAEIAARMRGWAVQWSELIHLTKRAIADTILGSEVRRLVRDYLAHVPELPEIDELPESAGFGAEHPTDSGNSTRSGGPDGAGAQVRRDEWELGDAMAELLACFPVYRSYLPWGRAHLDHAIEDASRRRPELAPAIAELATALGDPTHPAAVRFQQTSGMVMAKGVEDTAFYRVSQLASLTEVGADPDQFSLSPREFHDLQQYRLAAQPLSMTTLSTHDTKRGEDTRARITVLSEAPELWSAFLDRRRARRSIGGDGALENLLWESIVGSWPREREALHGYAEKAAREGGISTTWNDPDEDFEGRMHALIDDLFDDRDTREDVERTVAALRDAGWSNSLAAKALQLTGPGVPDVYQGSELWETSLVDPDNRRPVDFVVRRRMLSQLDDGWLPPVDESGAAKLLLTSRALRLRRDQPELFTRYTPLEAIGPAARHLIAVDRGGVVVLATRLPLGLAQSGGWHDTELILPAHPAVDVLTRRVHAGGALRVADVLERYPVALLERMEELL